MKSKINTTKIAGIAIFSALTVVVALVCQIIPPVAGFLSLDAKDAVISIASFVYGPMSAVIISFISSLIEIIFSTTGWYGFVMNFASSAVFSVTAALVYKKWRTLNGALAGFVAAIILTTGVMLVLNIFVTPIYMQHYLGIPMTSADVIDMIPKILLPFNFAKALMNAAIAMLIYKPVTMALKRARLISGQIDVKFNKRSVIVIIVGTVTLAAAITIFFIIS